METEETSYQQTLDAGETLSLDGQLAEIIAGAVADKEEMIFRAHQLMGLSTLMGHGSESFRAMEKSTVKVWSREAGHDMARRLAEEVQNLQSEARKQQMASSEQGVMSDRRHRDRDAMVSHQVKSGIADAAKSQGILRHWIYRFFGK